MRCSQLLDQDKAHLRSLLAPLGLTTILVDRQGLTHFLLLQGRLVAGNLPQNLARKMKQNKPLVLDLTLPKNHSFSLFVCGTFK